MIVRLSKLFLAVPLSALWLPSMRRMPGDAPHVVLDGFRRYFGCVPACPDCRAVTRATKGEACFWLCLVWRVLEPELCSMLHCRESPFVLNSSTFAQHAAVSASSPSDIKLTHTAILSQDCDHMTEAACNLTCAISPYSTATKCGLCAAPTSACLIHHATAVLLQDSVTKG